MQKPKILVITVSSWNSKVGANSWASLLEGYPSENIANISIREECPDSNICSRYFCISENKILKSIFKRKLKTGYEVTAEVKEENHDLTVHNERYKKLQGKRFYPLLLSRELVWKLGKWKSKELDVFIDSFKPDIIFLDLLFIHIKLNFFSKLWVLPFCFFIASF